MCIAWGHRRVRVPWPTQRRTRHWSRPPTASAALPLPAAAHCGRWGAPFNGARDCAFRAPYMANGMRTMQRASGVGNSWGPKPAKQRAAPASPPQLTARVLCPLRTQGPAGGSVVTRAGCQWRTHPRPTMGWCGACRVRTSARVVPKAPGVEAAATGRSSVSWAGTGALPHRLPALREDTTRPGCGRAGGGGGGGAKRLVVRLGTRCRAARGAGPTRPHKPEPGGGLPRVAVERQATPGLRQGLCEEERSETIALESGVRRKAPAPFGRGARL
jgi:hypothetical protein